VFKKAGFPCHRQASPATGRLLLPRAGVIMPMDTTQHITYIILDILSRTIPSRKNHQYIDRCPFFIAETLRYRGSPEKEPAVL